jgi:sulfate transport system permease protein
MARDALPGFRLTLGVTLGYLSILVLLPLGALFLRAGTLTPGDFVHAVTGHRALMAYALSFGASLTAAAINVAFGIIVAWVLVRYRFPGRRLVDALVDIPFALPTAVAGIALTAIYSENGPVGRFLPLAFSRAGVVIALVFVGLPFVVRTVQPVLHDLDPSIEEAAAVLGAGRTRIFFRVILPSLLPAIYTGFALAFARALGEYGSVVFISGNMPNRTEIIPLLIVTKLEQYDYTGATAIASVMLILSFGILFGINALQGRRQR